MVDFEKNNGLVPVIVQDIDTNEVLMLAYMNKKALELNPNHANNNGNYAIYLHTVAKDYKKAEKYYKKALALDSHHINNVKNYELFLLDKENKKKSRKSSS